MVGIQWFKKSTKNFHLITKQMHKLLYAQVVISFKEQTTQIYFIFFINSFQKQKKSQIEWKLLSILFITFTDLMHLWFLLSTKFFYIISYFLIRTQLKFIAHKSKIDFAIVIKHVFSQFFMIYKYFEILMFASRGKCLKS